MTVLQASQNPQNKILGYQLLERIGSGGFGEVWSAIAPGGLQKAVKIVYGFHDGRRAQAELKSLDRVKELRHPFLLSLERIEVDDGKLIVVSELADGSLSDRFNEYLKQGEPGIPRDEMLQYLRHAAEALDYLGNKHNLQHLDIKPENLLLVGSHLKVADFGLIKDLHQVSQSLMSGMTPAYAAPELFDGCPGKSSDQYSLAIVYQEMITGVRPFPGNTPAQLAAQHMRAKPNLNPLPKSDQAIIAKALSKDPELRFTSCREMAEELGHQRRATRKTIARRQSRRDLARTETSFDNGSSQVADYDVTAVISPESLPFQTAEIKIQDPIEDADQVAQVRPTLILGVGASGCRVIQKMKQRLVACHGSLEEIPSLRLLAIDTDRQTLGELQRGNDHESLSYREVLETPLRKPEDYRGRAEDRDLFKWLGRRWIYNIPRSSQTEGLRPLGRLAFADHFDAICDRIQQVVRDIVTPEAIAKTSQTLDIDPGEPIPRVFLAASVSGGVGSGMLLDLAYTTRLLIHECGMEPEFLTGILMHSCYQRNRNPGLSTANAFAFLTELRHLVENGYPGDPHLGMPDFEYQPPFEYTYFNELGDDLRQSEFDSQLDHVAEYLLLSTTSHCSTYLEACRKQEAEPETFSLRTFGLSVAGPTQRNGSAGPVQHVSRGLIRKWLYGDPDSEPDDDQLAQQLIEECGLDLDSVARLIQATVAEHLPGTEQDRFEQLHALVLENPDAAAAEVIRFTDEILGSHPQADDSSAAVEPEHNQAIEVAVGVSGQGTGEKLMERILAPIEGATMNLQLARRSVEVAVQRIDAMLDNLESWLQDSVAEEQEILDRLKFIPVAKANQKQAVRDQLCKLLDEFFWQRQKAVIRQHQWSFYRVVLNSIDAISNMLIRFHQQIESIGNEFKQETPVADEPLSASEIDVDGMLFEGIAKDRERHIAQTEMQVYRGLIQGRGGYRACLNDSAVWQSRLAGEVRNQSLRVLSDAYKKLSLDGVIVQNNLAPEQLAVWIDQQLVAAKPVIGDCGGASRLLIGLPELTEDESLEERLRSQLGINGHSVCGTLGNYVLCFEAEDVSLANVAFRLLQARPDAIELVKRIHTRNDVNWSTLDDLL